MAVELVRGRKALKLRARGVKAGGLEEAVNSRCRLKRQIHGASAPTPTNLSRQSPLRFADVLSAKR
jgi:hypothetical protein